MEFDRIASFRERVWEFYREHGRMDMPWRLHPEPYSVLVSEVMLQQTQVGRVMDKFAEWMREFPTVQAVAKTSGAEVLRVWQGLGYNRRGLWLREACRRVVGDYAGTVPNDPAELVKLPGIGPNTAASIAAFAYDVPVTFIETNIRRVFIHEFFPEREGLEEPVSDAELMPIISSALDPEHPREWYWALMDYGAWLAKVVPNPNRRSKHYSRQSVFEGSLRQVRGEVLRQLLGGAGRVADLNIPDDRLPVVLDSLERDGLVVRNGESIRLAD